MRQFRSGSFKAITSGLVLLAVTACLPPDSSVGQNTTTTTRPTTTTTFDLSEDELFDVMVEPFAQDLGITLARARAIADDSCDQYDAGASSEDVFFAMLDWAIAEFGDDFNAGQAAGFIQGFGISLFCSEYSADYTAFANKVVEELLDMG